MALYITTVMRCIFRIVVSVVTRSGDLDLSVIVISRIAQWLEYLIPRSEEAQHPARYPHGASHPLHPIFTHLLNGYPQWVVGEGSEWEKMGAVLTRKLVLSAVSTASLPQTFTFCPLGWVDG